MKTNVLAKSLVEFEFLDSCNRDLLLKDLSDVSHLYPYFEGWLTFKFLGNLSRGQRKLLVAHNGDSIVGYSLLKQDSQESKICTFYVKKEYRAIGIGQELMTQSLQTLDSSDAFITVADERLKELSPLLKAKGFKLSSSILSMYRDGSSEHVWSL